MASASKRNLYIGLALVVGIIITLILVTVVGGDDASEGGKQTAPTTPSASTATDSEYSDTDDSNDCSADDEFQGCEDGETPTRTQQSTSLELQSLEGFQSYLQMTDDSWLDKAANLQSFIFQHSPTIVACVDHNPDDSNLGLWNYLVRNSKEAPAALRAYFEESVAVYDGIDAIALMTELDASSPDDTAHAAIFAKYGLDLIEDVEKRSELAVRHKTGWSGEQFCAYDIDYNLPE